MRNLVRILRARYKIVYFISTKHQQALVTLYQKYKFKFHHLKSIGLIYVLMQHNAL